MWCSFWLFRWRAMPEIFPCGWLLFGIEGSSVRLTTAAVVGSNRIIVFPLSSSSAMLNVEGGVCLNCRNEETQAPPPFIYIYTHTHSNGHDKDGKFSSRQCGPQSSSSPNPHSTMLGRTTRRQYIEDNHGNIAAKESRLSTIKSHAVRRARRLARYQCAVLRF